LGRRGKEKDSALVYTLPHTIVGSFFPFIIKFEELKRISVKALKYQKLSLISSLKSQKI